MSPADTTAAKRKLLVETLLMCLSKSKVKEVVDLDTIGSVLQSGMGEMWRAGELRLEMPWKILTREPGLSEGDVAPPFLVFKTYEADLGVRVVLPDALAGVTDDQLEAAREASGLAPGDFGQVVTRLRELEQEEARTRDALQSAVVGDSAGAPAKAKVKIPLTRQAWARVALSVGLFAFSGFWVWWSFSDGAASIDLSELAPLIRLDDGKMQGKAIAARIVDPKWDDLSKQQRIDLMKQVFEQLKPRGVEMVSLTDGTRTRAVASELGGMSNVEVY